MCGSMRRSESEGCEVGRFREVLKEKNLVAISAWEML